MTEEEEMEIEKAKEIIVKHIRTMAKECESKELRVGPFLCGLTEIIVRIIFTEVNDPTLAKQAIDGFIAYETNNSTPRIESILH